MKKLMALLVVCCFALGCFSMRYAAPPGSEVKVISEEQPAQFKKSVKVWYALWGLVPINENNSARLIKEYQLKEARVTTKVKFVDYLIAIFTGVASIVPATMEIEGNR